MKLSPEHLNKLIEEINRFRELAVLLETEGMGVEKILHTLKNHLKAKFGYE